MIPRDNSIAILNKLCEAQRLLHEVFQADVTYPYESILQDICHAGNSLWCAIDGLKLFLDDTDLSKNDVIRLRTQKGEPLKLFSVRTHRLNMTQAHHYRRSLSADAEFSMLCSARNATLSS